MGTKLPPLLSQIQLQNNVSVTTRTSMTKADHYGGPLPLPILAYVDWVMVIFEKHFIAPYGSPLPVVVNRYIFDLEANNIYRGSYFDLLYYL